MEEFMLYLTAWTTLFGPLSWVAWNHPKQFRIYFANRILLVGMALLAAGAGWAMALGASGYPIDGPLRIPGMWSFFGMLSLFYVFFLDSLPNMFDLPRKTTEQELRAALDLLSEKVSRYESEIDRLRVQAKEPDPEDKS